MLERPGGGANRNSSAATAAVAGRLSATSFAWSMSKWSVVQVRAGVRPLWLSQSEPDQLGRVAWSAQIRPPAAPLISTSNTARYSAAWVSSLLLQASRVLAQRMILRRKALSSPATVSITGTG